MAYTSKSILYIHFEDVLNPSKAGIINKINGQKEAFSKLGFNTQIISFRTKHKLYLDDTCLLHIPSRILLFRYFIFRKIRFIIARSKFDFIYIRYFGSDSHFIRFLQWIKQQHIKIFLEFPTFPYDAEIQAKNVIEKCIFRLDRYYRNKLSNYVYRAISFTFEGSILNMTTLKLENGISLENIHLTPRSADTSSLHMVGVANVSRWHGYDRLLRGIYEYKNQEYKPRKVTFTIVGSGNSLHELKALCNELELENYVFFSGPKSGLDLDYEFQKAHLAIGSLGMHRIGLLKGSVLKLGEYVARGFPVVIAYDDFSLKEEVPFVLKIPPDETPVDVGSLIGFYDHINISPESIRDYATCHFSWDQKMERVIASL